MGKIIEAKAVISAQDKTGAVFDKIAKKFEGIAKAGKTFEGIRAPVLGKAGWGQSFQREIDALRVSSKELAGIQKSWSSFNTAMSQNGPMRAAKYFGAVDQWKNKTLSNLREVRLGMDETQKHHKKFLAEAGHLARHTAGHVIGGFGAAYVAGHGIKHVIKAAAERNREGIRYEQMGLTPDEQARASVVASRISSAYPSISRTDVLSDLRKNASRLGGFDRAKEIAEVYAKAKIMNKLSGGDEHELEQVVRAAEGVGAANTPAQFKQFLNAFTKAKAANPDYTGEQFRSDFAAAGSAKYGLGRDYMENVFPILASHTSGFGVKLATSNSALIGGRMTKQSRAAMTAAGLLDKNGNLVEQELYQKNPYEWTQKIIKPKLEAEGVHFGEHMSEHDKRIVSAKTTRWFSAKNTSDQIITNLLDAALVERSRGRKTLDLDAAPKLQRDDAGIAWEGLKTQVSDVTTAFISLKSSVSGMNAAAGIFSKMAKAVETGKMPEKDTPFTRATGPSARLQRINERMKHSPGMPEATLTILRQKAFDAQMEINRAKSQEGMPDTLFSEKEIEDWKTGGPPIPWKGRVPFPHRDPRGGFPKSDFNVPLPESDPRPRTLGMPPVQPMDAGPTKVDVSGEVHGEMKQTITVEAGSYLKVLIATAEQVVKLYGSLNHGGNGPGSAGHSSPDAAAVPSAPSTGHAGASSTW